MHELGVVEGIREIALSHARSAGASRILSVRVAIAKSSRYLEDALAMFWDEVCGTSEASGAQIEFVHVPGEWLCLACSKSFAGGREVCRCPECGSQWVKPVDAPECYVESIEVETGAG
ncbi:MAG TPA: hydrogenase maturation nickel metallochaperone HypA [Bryobacteraceae bacterium]|jgi:hydrogenase nickel insertion protein HypA|nr:hydrogenase maturation nickel metallochaperone HypA [Bryobacteraceae bacterium]